MGPCVTHLSYIFQITFLPTFQVILFFLEVKKQQIFVKMFCWTNAPFFLNFWLQFSHFHFHTCTFLLSIKERNCLRPDHLTDVIHFILFSINFLKMLHMHMYAYEFFIECSRTFDWNWKNLLGVCFYDPDL